ncbi:hypothetical protein HanIR_Chr17g0896211 [Helianthus annuus]|nr:hypothetical protein HanIR_Chr17g0896211 [Helianthus annuus]
MTCDFFIFISFDSFGMYKLNNKCSMRVQIKQQMLNVLINAFGIAGRHLEGSRYIST